MLRFIGDAVLVLVILALTLLWFTRRGISAARPGVAGTGEVNVCLEGWRRGGRGQGVSAGGEIATASR